MADGFSPGDEVTVEWGLDTRKARVLSTYGPEGNLYARVEIELTTEDDEITGGGVDVEVVSLPVDLLTRAA